MSELGESVNYRRVKPYRIGKIDLGKHRLLRNLAFVELLDILVELFGLLCVSDHRPFVVKLGKTVHNTRRVFRIVRISLKKCFNFCYSITSVVRLGKLSFGNQGRIFLLYLIPLLYNFTGNQTFYFRMEFLYLVFETDNISVKRALVEEILVNRHVVVRQSGFSDGTVRENR